MTTELATPGTIFVSTWGYDQTNVDFHQVTRSTAHSIWLKPIRSATVEAAGWGAKVVAVPDSFCGSEFRRRPQRVEGKLYARIDTVSCARPWDGEPVHRSTWA